MRKLSAIVLLALVVLSGQARAAGTRVGAAIQPSGTATDTEAIRLTIQVVGAQSGEITPPRLPPMKNLRIVNGPSSSSQFSWVNGEISSSASFTWMLVAEGPGPAEIPGVQVRIGSSTYRTDPIQIQITKGATGPRTAPQPGRPPDVPARAGDPDVFLRAELSTKEVWVGQPVTLTLTVFASGEIANYSLRDAPTFSNFWSEDLKVDPNTERYRATIEGRVYIAYPLQRKLLTPTVAGDLTLEPYAAQFRVQRRSSDPFADFFGGGRAEDIMRKSDALTLHVRALPEAGRPAGFAGAVGSFKIDTKLDRREAEVNQAVALTVTVEGEGLLKSVGTPRLDAPAELKVFDPEITESSAASNGKFRSKKTWEWVLVPLVPGSLEMPAPTFAYFDPQQGAYREIHGAPIQIVARRGERSEPDTLARGEVRLQRREINFIKPLRGTLSDGAARAHELAWFRVALLLPLAWVPAVIAIGRWRARSRLDRTGARAGKARSRSRRRLRTAQRRAAQLDAGAFHEEIARALVEYVADRFDRSAAGLTYELADDLLESHRVSPELRARFRSCLESCDFARYVPGSGSDPRKAEVLGEAMQLVDLLEKAL